MKNQPPVSIHIVTYMNSAERGEVLKRTVEVALAQRYPAFEVVVADNRGAYSAEEALASIKDPRLKVYRNKENVGFAGNINLCLEYCAHDVIKPLCDDDLIHPDFLSQTVPFVDDETMVVVDVEKFLFGTEPEAMGWTVGDVETERRPLGYGRDIWRLSYASSSIPSATLFTRNLFEQLGKYDVKTVTSDWDFFIETCLYRNITHVCRTLCFVGVWAGSLTEEMMGKPFFYPTQGLYSRIRVLRCKAMPGVERLNLAWLLAKEFMVQSLRPLKRMNKTYFSGYRQYAGRFFQLLLQPRSAFGNRPNQR